MFSFSFVFSISAVVVFLYLYLHYITNHVILLFMFVCVLLFSTRDLFLLGLVEIAKPFYDFFCLVVDFLFLFWCMSSISNGIVLLRLF